MVDNAFGQEVINQEDMSSQVKGIDKRIKDMQKMIDGMVKVYGNEYGDRAGKFLNRSEQEWTDEDNLIAEYNPNMAWLSRDIDKKRKEISLLEDQKINLENAGGQIFGSLDRAEGNIRSSAESGLRGVAQQEAQQLGAAQGLAGKAGASTGSLSRMSSEISNQYAPQRQQIMQQRDTGLTGINQARAAAPAQLQAIASQNISNETNNAKLKELYKQLSTSS